MPLASVVRQAFVAAARGIVAAWRRRSLSRRDAYLSYAVDMVDLERRMREWDDRESGRRRWPPAP